MISNPTSIRSAFVTALKAIPALVTLLGGSAANIIEYDEATGGDINSTIVNGLKNNQLLVYIESVQLASGVRDYFKIQLAVPVKSESVWSVWAAICNGTGPDGQPLIGSTILPGYHPMENPTVDRSSILVSDTTSLDYFVIKTSFQDLGI